jgi:hypothetical protein
VEGEGEAKVGFCGIQETKLFGVLGNSTCYPISPHHVPCPRPGAEKMLTGNDVLGDLPVEGDLGMCRVGLVDQGRTPSYTLKVLSSSFDQGMVLLPFGVGYSQCWPWGCQSESGIDGCHWGTN